jgi:hypothetical protein
MLKRRNDNNLSHPHAVSTHNVCFSSHFSTNILALYKHSFRKQGCFFYGSLSTLLQTSNILPLYSISAAAYIALVITVELIHGKKSFSILSSPAGISLTKLSLGGNNLYRTSLFLLRQSLVSDTPYCKAFLRFSYTLSAIDVKLIMMMSNMYLMLYIYPSGYCTLGLKIRDVHRDFLRDIGITLEHNVTLQYLG